MSESEEHVSPPISPPVNTKKRKRLKMKYEVDNPIRVDSFSWVTEQIFPPLENQRTNICWAHALVDLLEGLYYKKYKIRIKLSRQEILDKCYPDSTVGREYGVVLEDAVKWISRNGISKEEDYPTLPTGLKDVPRERKSGCRIVEAFYLESYNGRKQEDDILRCLENVPGIAHLHYCRTAYRGMKERAKEESSDNLVQGEVYQMYKATYDNPKKADHTVILAGWDDTGVNSYWVRDPNGSNAPYGGEYKVKRKSAVDSRLEINPIYRVYFFTDVHLGTVD